MTVYCVRVRRQQRESVVDRFPGLGESPRWIPLGRFESEHDWGAWSGEKVRAAVERLLELYPGVVRPDAPVLCEEEWGSVVPLRPRGSEVWYGLFEVPEGLVG